MRTIKDFVADMIQRGRTQEQIKTVAAAFPRWEDSRDEVAAECSRQFKTKKEKK